MIYHQVKDPVSYQTVFYKQIGLKKHETGDGSGMENDWSSPEIGYIYTFGSMDTMQFGIGEYTVSVDFLSEFQYDTEYLHAGIIYEGVTYSLVDNKMEELAIPSMFLAMEKASGGINCWKKGQHFKGIELSIEMEYLKKEILPFLGISEKALDFLERNVPVSASAPGTSGHNSGSRTAAERKSHDYRTVKRDEQSVRCTSGPPGNSRKLSEWRSASGRKNTGGEKADSDYERRLSENCGGT